MANCEAFENKIEKGKLTMSKMLGVALSEVRGLLGDLLEKLSGEGWEVWLAELKLFLRKEPCWVVVKTNPYFKVLAISTLKATTGERTLAQAINVFTGYLDSGFVKWRTDVDGQPTEEALFEVLELVKDGKFEQVFSWSLDELCWSQDQIITFVEEHGDLLHPKGYATFFLFKVSNEFFIANANRGDDGQLRVDVYRLSHGYVWFTELRYRFVVPQLS